MPINIPYLTTPRKRRSSVLWYVFSMFDAAYMCPRYVGVQSGMFKWMDITWEENEGKDCLKLVVIEAGRGKT